MKHKALAALAASLVLAHGVAEAKAFASITLDGAPALYSVGSDANSTYLDNGATLTYGQTWTYSVNYTVTLESDGLATTRDWNYCTPIMFGMTCGFAPTGTEGAEVNLTWALDSRYGNYDGLDISATNDVDFYIGKGQSTYSGTMTFTATDIDPGYLFGPTHFVSAGLIAAYFVDSNPASPIPETSTFALLLAGLGCISALRRRYS